MLEQLSIQEQLFGMMKRQGLSFAILTVIVYYFYSENNRLNDRIDKMADDNKTINADYQVDHQQMRNVIERNTVVIERSTAVFEMVIRSKKNAD